MGPGEASDPVEACGTRELRPRAPCGKRLSVVLSVTAFFVLGVPLWHLTRGLSRTDLPLDVMLGADVKMRDLLPISVRLWLCTGEGVEGSLPGAGGHINLILGSMQTTGANPHAIEGMQVVATWVTPHGCSTADPLKLLRGKRLSGSAKQPCPEVHKALAELSNLTDDESLEAALEKSLGAAEAGRGTIDVFLIDVASLPSSPLGSGQSLVLGQGRSAWSLGQMWSEGQVPGTRIFSPAMADAVGAAAAAMTGRGEKKTEVGNGDQLLIGSGSLKLLLSLGNAHPPSGACRWDVGWLETDVLQPVLDALRPLGHISLESQVLQYTQSQVRGAWDPRSQAYIMRTDQLPFFVDPDWSLEPDRAVVGGGGYKSKSFSASAPAASNLLHFLVYIPPPEQRPLRIAGHSSKQKANGIEPSSSFTLTSWGGVALHSPEQGCCATSAKSTGNETSAGPCSRHRQMGEQELTDLARVLVTQLRHALQLQDADGMVVATQGGGVRLRIVPARRQGFADWEVDLMIRQQVRVLSSATTSTLAALARLVQSLPNLPIPEQVAELTELALRGLHEADMEAAAGSYASAASAMRSAKVAADLAFFHPSIMGERSYPAQHLVAMYMPYFLPISMPIIRGLTSEIKRRFPFRCLRRASLGKQKPE